MPLQALLLVLIAALLHATWNVAAKKAGGGDAFVLLSALIVTVLWAPVCVVAGWHELPRWGWLEWAVAAASGAIHLVYFRTLLRGYRESDLTIVHPVARGHRPAVELRSWRCCCWARAGAAGAAGVSASRSPCIAGGLGRAPGAQRRAAARACAPGCLGMATGALICGYTVLDGWAVKVLLVSPILLDYFGNALRVPFMLPAALRDRAGYLAAWRAQWRYAMLSATLGPIAYVLVLYAVKLAPLSHVAPAREVSMLFAALLGGRLLGEGDRGLRLAGAAAIAAGVIALASG
jgi:drug/metabolite transporter (DMT)-like permease